MTPPLPIKILHVTQSLKGGPASYFDEILPSQIELLGQDNIAICVPETDLDYLSPLSRETVQYTFRSPERSLKSLTDFYRVLKSSMAAFKPDIVHLHSSFAGAIGRLIPAMPGSAARPRVIYCAHGWAFDMKGSKSGALFALVERALAGRADAIVNISGADQASAIRRGIGRGKSRVILNGVADIPPPAESKDEQQRALGMDPSKVNLLFVGRFDRQKGVDLAIAAMRRLDPAHYHLYVIGDYVVSTGQGRDNPAISGADHISLLGWKERSALPPWFAAVDALVMPSRWEGFGLAAVEAMRMGTAVIASRAGALPELVVNGTTGRLVPPDDQIALGDILLSESKDSLHGYGRAGRRLFEEKFTSARLNRELSDLYAELTRLS